jgi:hypothetical protein
VERGVPYRLWKVLDRLAVGADQIDGTDGREYELGVDILWDTDCWTITTEARVTNEPAGQDILRRLPERTADNLSTCVQQLRAAIDELVNFEDLVLAHGPLE